MNTSQIIHFEGNLSHESDNRFLATLIQSLYTELKRYSSPYESLPSYLGVSNSSELSHFKPYKSIAQQEASFKRLETVLKRKYFIENCNDLKIVSLGTPGRLAELIVFRRFFKHVINLNIGSSEARSTSFSNVEYGRRISNIVLMNNAIRDRSMGVVAKALYRFSLQTLIDFNYVHLISRNKVGVLLKSEVQLSIHETRNLENQLYLRLVKNRNIKNDSRREQLIIDYALVLKYLSHRRMARNYEPDRIKQIKTLEAEIEKSKELLAQKDNYIW
jgi:hypothetical protein